MNPDNITIRKMTRDEFDTLVDWAADEGWNPGLDDADVFWETDPEGYIAAEMDGDLIGGGSIISYGGQYGFMGFFIIRSDLRGRGLGSRLWHERKRLLQERLVPGASIGLDGVFDMQAYYAKGGFDFVCRDLRFEAQGFDAPSADGVVNASTVPFEDLDEYDSQHFPARRTKFLRRWLERPGGHAVAAVGSGSVDGYAVMRPCRIGHKIGPLFATNGETAERLFVTLASKVPGEPIFLDAPEINPDALTLAGRHGMNEVFGCARMVLGPVPQLPDHEIFGVTTFELG